MKRAPLILAAVAVLLSACGGGGGASVTDAWARASAPGQTSGAVYFRLRVDSDDTLLGASVPASVAGRAEIHEVVMAETSEESMDEASMDDMSMSEGSDDMETSGEMGAMRMQELENGLVLSAGSTVSFEPGSYHVMLAELAAPLAIGDEFVLTLDLANADDVAVTVEVAESAP